MLSAKTKISGDRYLTPRDHDSPDPDTWAEVFQQDVAGEFHKNIWYEEDGHNSAISDSSQVKLLDNVVFWLVIVKSSGVSKVDSIQIVDEVCNTDPWQDVKINFPHNFSFNLKLMLDAEFTVGDKIPTSLSSSTSSPETVALSTTGDVVLAST